jgi:hypothetical protein
MREIVEDVREKDNVRIYRESGRKSVWLRMCVFAEKERGCLSV